MVNYGETALWCGCLKLALFPIAEVKMVLLYAAISTTSADLTLSVPMCPDMDDTGRMGRAYSAPGSNHRS